MLRRFILAAFVALAAFVLAACTGPVAPQSATQTPAPTSAPAPVSPVEAMTIEQRQTLIAPNFQVEVPVPMGDVVRGEAQGDTAWDYEIVVAAPPDAVARWYRDTYAGREWQVLQEESQPDGTLTLVLVKNAAQTRVTIASEGSDKSRVKAVLGVGTPVLDTQ